MSSSGPDAGRRRGDRDRDRGPRARARARPPDALGHSARGRRACGCRDSRSRSRTRRAGAVYSGTIVGLERKPGRAPTSPRPRARRCGSSCGSGSTAAPARSAGRSAARAGDGERGAVSSAARPPLVGRPAGAGSRDCSQASRRTGAGLVSKPSRPLRTAAARRVGADRRGRARAACGPRRRRLPDRPQAGGRRRRRAAGRSSSSTRPRASRRAARTGCSLRHVPHLVLDGAVLAAEALGAHEAIVALGGLRSWSCARSADAIDARARRRLDRRVRAASLSRSPRAFVAGEETALVRFLNGGPAKPTFTPPRPFERGVGGAPTLVQNAETLAHLALIARFGAEWFRELGTPDEPGSALVTSPARSAGPACTRSSSGRRSRELLAAGRRADGAAAGVPRRRLLRHLARTRAASDAPAARMPRSCPSGQRSAPGDRRSARGGLRPRRDRARRPLSRGESAGQCGPCVTGSLRSPAASSGSRREQATAGATLAPLGRAVRGRGACRHPDGAARFVASALDVLRGRGRSFICAGRCSGHRPLVLPLPRGDQP